MKSTLSLLSRLGGERGLEILLRDFYGTAREDEILGPIFQKHVANWEYHMERVVIYWRRQTEGEPNYKQGFPARHRPLRLRHEHFERWLGLFRASCDRVLPSGQADEVYDIASRVAEHLAREVVR